MYHKCRVAFPAHRVARLLTSYKHNRILWLLLAASMSRPQPLVYYCFDYYLSFMNFSQGLKKWKTLLRYCNTIRFLVLFLISLVVWFIFTAWSVTTLGWWHIFSPKQHIKCLSLILLLTLLCSRLETWNPQAIRTCYLSGLTAGPPKNSIF